LKELSSSERSRLRDMFDAGVSNTDDSQAVNAVERAERRIKELEKSGVPSAASDIWNDIKDLGKMVSDWISGNFKAPYRTITAAVFTLLYFVNPFDVIPDFVPMVGYIDDVFIVSLCLKMVSSDLEKYREWKTSRRND